VDMMGWVCCVLELWLLITLDVRYGRMELMMCCKLSETAVLEQLYASHHEARHNMLTSSSVVSNVYTGLSELPNMPVLCPKPDTSSLGIPGIRRDAA
jgi:hypothetical protein